MFKPGFLKDIFFLNANDVFYDEYVLQKVVAALIENPEAKILFGDVDYIVADKQKSKIRSSENIKNDFSLILGNICHQGIFYHKSLFEQFGLYSEQFEIYADWDFNIKCLVQNRVFAIYLPTVVSRFQLGGICSNQGCAKTRDKEKKDLIKKYYKSFYFLILTNQVLKKKLGVIYKILINISFAKMIADLYASQDKYKLNIKTIL